MDAVAPAGLSRRIGVKRPRQQQQQQQQQPQQQEHDDEEENDAHVGQQPLRRRRSSESPARDTRRSDPGSDIEDYVRRAYGKGDKWTLVQDLALGWAVRGRDLEATDFEAVARQLGHEHSTQEYKARAFALRKKFKDAPWSDQEDDRLKHQMSLPGSSLEVVSSTSFPWRSPEQVKARWENLERFRKDKEDAIKRSASAPADLSKLGSQQITQVPQDQRLVLLQKLLSQQHLQPQPQHQHQQHQQQHQQKRDDPANVLAMLVQQQQQQQQQQVHMQAASSLGLEAASLPGDATADQLKLLQQFKADQENLMRKLELNQQMNAALMQETARLVSQFQQQQQQQQPASSSSSSSSSRPAHNASASHRANGAQTSSSASLAATSKSPSPSTSPPASPKPLSSLFVQNRQGSQAQQHALRAPQSMTSSFAAGAGASSSSTSSSLERSNASLPLPEAQALFVRLLANQQQRQQQQHPHQQQQHHHQQMDRNSAENSPHFGPVRTGGNNPDSALQLKHHLLNQLANPELQRALATRDAQANMAATQGYSAANQVPSSQSSSYGLFANPSALAHALTAQMQRISSANSNDDEHMHDGPKPEPTYAVPKSYSNGRPISGAVPGTENTGRWTNEEHARFLSGIAKYGTKHWTAIANVVKTRTVVQVRTHAQKFFKKRGILRPNADPEMARAVVEESVAAFANGKTSRSPSPSSDGSSTA